MADMIPVYVPGDMQREPYRSTPYRDLLFRNFNLLLYFTPEPAAQWMRWFVHDDFGNLVRTDIGRARVYHRNGSF